MSSFVAAGLLAYGCYQFCKFSYKQIKKLADETRDSKPHKNNKDEVSDKQNTSDELIEALYRKDLDWLSTIQISSQTFTEKQLVEFLEKINARLYAKFNIVHKGHLVTKKNLSSFLKVSESTHFSSSLNMEFFVFSGSDRIIFYVKNEFYEISNTQTECMYAKIEDIASAIAGVGLIGMKKLMLVVYQNGETCIFNVEDENAIYKIVQQNLGMTIQSAVVSKKFPIFATINNNYEEQLWNIQNGSENVLLFNKSFKHLINDSGKKLLCQGLIAEPSIELFATVLFFENSHTGFIEGHTLQEKDYECIHSIPYSGSIVCATYDSESHVFAYYQQGGDQEGVYIYNTLEKKVVAYFKPYQRHEKHPVKICMQGDKLFCIYADGMMDMWGFAASQYDLVQSSIQSIISSLPVKQQLEFLTQFGLYLTEQTENNYNLLLKIASIGLPMHEVKIAMGSLHFPLHKE